MRHRKHKMWLITRIGVSCRCQVDNPLMSQTMLNDRGSMVMSHTTISILQLNMYLILGNRPQPWPAHLLTTRAATIRSVQMTSRNIVLFRKQPVGRLENGVPQRNSMISSSQALKFLKNTSLLLVMNVIWTYSRSISPALPQKQETRVIKQNAHINHIRTLVSVVSIEVLKTQLDSSS